MNILFLIDDLCYRGRARRLSLLATALPRDRFAVRVFTLRPDAPWSRTLREASIPVQSGNRRRLFDARPLFALRKAVRDAVPDVIHVFGLPALRALAAAGGRHGARVLQSAAAPSQRAARLGLLDRSLIAALVDRVAAGGPAEAARCRQLRIAAAKIIELPIGVPPATPPRLPHDAWCRSLGLPANARVIIGVGPLEMSRGFREGIWAFDILKFLYDDLHLILVGAGPREAQLRQFARITRSTGRVHFLGEQADLDELLGHAEVAWVPSRADHGAMAVLEAMAAGRPVVASRWPGLAEVIAEGETGVLVPPGDQAALVRETRLLLDDSQRRQRLGEAGGRRVAERFGLDAMVRAYEAAYAALIC